MYYLIILLLIPLIGTQQMTLCEYLHQLGRTDPFCPDYWTSVSSTTEGSRLAKMISVLEEREARRKAVTFSRKSRWALCETQKYRVDCREDQLSCESGYSCLSPSDDGRCCISPTADVLLPSNPTSCPSTSEMGYTCTYGSKRKVTNWCRTNEDCVAGAVHLCCDTGCGFNVCLPSTGHVLDNGIRPIVNSRCPPPTAMGVKCRARRSTNWCNSDLECQMFTSPSIPQSCCPTSCGYNACVANDGYHFAFG